MTAYYSPAAYATRIGSKPLQEVRLSSKVDGHETRMFVERFTDIDESEATPKV